MNKSPGNNSYYFEQLPFFWHPLEDYRNNIFPKTMPFELCYDSKEGVLKQKVNPDVVEVVSRAYQQGSEIVGLMDDHGIGCEYAGDFLDFINSVINLSRVRGKEILEIGCGTGYLLYRLQAMGAQVTGYEPGFSRIGKFAVPVFETTFPPGHLQRKQFDIIIAYGLLEHVVDLEKIMTAIYQCLKNEGTVLVSVPDCEEYISNGDISMLFHEHFSYFTKKSFSGFAQRKLFTVSNIQKAHFGGGIYFVLRKKGPGNENNENLKSDNLFQEIIAKINLNIKRMRYFLKRCENKTLGVYCPSRALNILSLCKEHIREFGISLRFFDDSQSLIGKYLPGFDVKIEDRGSLLNNLPDKILVYSYTFAKKITGELKDTLTQRIEVIGAKDLPCPEGGF